MLQRFFWLREGLAAFVQVTFKHSADNRACRVGGLLQDFLKDIRLPIVVLLAVAVTAVYQYGRGEVIL